MQIKYNYNKFNGKEWVLFLHGWGGNENSFLELYNNLNGKYNVLSINLSNITTNYLNKPLTMYDYVIAVSIILNKLKIIKCHIVCHSFGFRIALILNRVQTVDLLSLVIIDGAGIKDNSLITKLKIIKYKFFKMLVKFKLLKPSILNKYGSQDYKNLTNKNKQTFINIVNLNLKSYVKYINAKCTIIWGKYDKDTKLKIAKYLHKKINNSKLIIYNTGHFSYLENNIEFLYDMEEHFNII